MSRSELARLMLGPEEDAIPKGVGTVRFVVKCPGDSERVLRKSAQVLERVFQNAKEPWPQIEEWRTCLPGWFVERCAPEITQEEAERRLALPLEERKQLAEVEGWSLSSWLYWFQPEERHWFWWDAMVQDEDTILVAVEVQGWPFPWGSLEWLFRASGALSVAPE